MLHLSYKVNFHGLSDVGLVRKSNEDVWGAIPDCYFYVLADGMGGHNAGEIAAQETVSLLEKSVVKLDHEGENHDYSPQEMASKLEEIILGVNALIYQKSLESKELHGMGTTVCCLYAFHDQMIYAHVGDSRIYRFTKEKKKLEQLTVDHSLVNELISLGQLTEEEAADFPFRNVLTRSIGTNPHLDVSVNVCPISQGDLFLMCSDGLTNYSDFFEIEALLSHSLKKGLPLQEISQNLIQLAKDHGGGDNITLVIVKFDNHEAKADLFRQ